MIELTEKEFREELERILDREFGVDILIIGIPNGNLKWYVSLRIAEMIGEYYKKRQKEEINIDYSYRILDHIVKSTKMNIHDVLIIRLIPTEINGIYTFLDSKRQEKKHFIYVSDNSKILKSHNDRLNPLVVFYFEVIGISNDKIKCIAQKTQKEIEFSKPEKKLVDDYFQFRGELIKNFLKGSE